MDGLPIVCPECSGTDVAWYPYTTHYYLACEECSATIRRMTFEDAAKFIPTRDPITINTKGKAMQRA